MKITPTKLSINQLFSTRNEQFYIPAYQRRYSWGRKHVGDLFKDVDRLAETDSHLLGSMVCLTETHVAGINRLEVVDGQQRLTTLAILLDAMREKYAGLGDEENEKEISGLLSCRDVQGQQENKLLLGDLDDPDYQRLMNRDEVQRMRNECLRGAHGAFAEWLDEFSHEQLNSFLYKLLNNVDVIRLDVGHAKDAYKLFETINNRGLSLSPTDIIKNFLLGHASMLGEEVLEQVKGCWKGVIVNCDGFDSDDFFRQYMCCILRRKVSHTTLIDTFKEHYLGSVKEAEALPDYALFFKLEAKEEEDQASLLDGEDLKQEISENGGQLLDADDETERTKQKESINEFAKRLRDASEVYGRLRRRDFKNPRIARRLLNLQRIKSFPTYILLLDVFSQDLDDGTILSVLGLLETFMLRRHICEYRTGELDDIFSKLTPVRRDDVEGAVSTQLGKHLPSDNEFKGKFPFHDYKSHSNRAKYVLEVFEYDLIGDKGEYVLAGGDDLHLEHIIPQTIITKKSKREFGDWETYLGEGSADKHVDYVNKIGNLTLLARSLNIVASNNPFHSKQGEYAKSNIVMTKALSTGDQDFRFSEVDARSLNLAEKAIALWRFPGDEAEIS